MGNAAMQRASAAPVPLPPSLASAPAASLATFGAGCYWGTEKYFRQFGETHPGITDMRVGFMGPPEAAPNPSYKDVCSGSTGHVEVLQLRFDPAALPYDELVKHFFTFHDSTTANRQGNDVGTQYASAIFAHTEEQRATALARIAKLQALLDTGAVKGLAGGRVATEVRPATTFYAAHEEHQRYLENNPRGYCNHMRRFQWPSSA